ncbi:MAG: T9SS type A sorting domain-containing protein [Bacteroidia bacterium]|nr:T9SS type A sorting domain-containing protein [Bacteroidia bacterium]
MKKIKLYIHLLFATVLFLSLGNTAQATHLMGSDIFYRHLSGMQYEIKIKYYRDCRGVPFANPSGETKIRCTASGGMAKNLSLTLLTIKDVTPTCLGAKLPCDPQNTMGTGLGVEEHIYMDTIDFNDATYSGLLSCTGDLVIETQQCCRNGAITTGPANANFYTYALFNYDISKLNNSTPIFEIPPIYKAYVNQPMIFAIGATDTIDYDSLSFHFEEPLNAYKSNIAYSSGYSFEQAFSAYYPSGFSFPYSNPNANPPVGIYLDSLTGTITATPINAGQVTVLVIVVKEWRKDSNGIPQLIAKTRRDCQIIFDNVLNNNLPQLTINNPGKQATGAGCVSFVASDKAFTPPFPGPPIRNDSLTVTLIGNNQHLQMTIDSMIYDTASSTIYGRVCYDSVWTTLGNNNIYMHVRDNSCDWNSEVSKGIHLNFTRTTGGTKPLNKKALAIDVYPNPVDNWVTISAQKMLSKCQLVMVDINGKTVLSQTIENLNSTTLSLSEFDAGCYFLHIKSNEGDYFKKIMVK